MNQQQFLTALKEALESLKLEGIPEILIDYESHFKEGLRSGKTEELISAKLGYPMAIAKAYQAESMIRQVQTKQETFRWGFALQIVARFILIAPFNFFILLIPGILIFTLLTVGWSLTAGLGAGAIALLAWIFQTSFFSLGWWAGAAAVSGGLSLLGLSFLFCLIGFLICKQILLALLSYLQWNLKFVLDKKQEMP